MVVLCVAGLGVLLFAAPRKPQSPAVRRLRRALGAARTASTGYPLFGKNPYLPVLKILRVDRGQLPLIWQSRALAQYAQFLDTPGWANYTTTVPPKKYLKVAKALLLRAVQLSPGYVTGWLGLHRVAAWRATPSANAEAERYLITAYRLDPHNPVVAGLRAWEIWQAHGAHNIRPGLPPPPGHMGFLSARWVHAFCYRALVFLKYQDRIPRHWAQQTQGWRRAFGAALKRYEPGAYAEAMAGTWKPGPCPDPWPPPATQPARKAATTRRAKSAAPGNAK